MMWSFNNHKEKVAAIQENGQSITYGQLEEVSHEISMQIPHRSLIFSLCENSIGSLVGYTSFLNNQMVPLLLDSGLDQELLDNLIEVYQPGYFWIANQKKAAFLQQYPQCLQTWEAYDYALIKTPYDVTPLHEDLALLLTTSGSTGSPKLVRQSYKNIESNAKAIAEYLEITDQERPITTLPMNYTYGLSIINSHLCQGATILLTNKGLMQKEFWTFFKQEEATSFGGVPYTFEMLKRLRFFRMALPSLQSMTQAGGKLSPELHKEFAQYAQDHQKRFYVMYGQTEATARMSYLPYKESLKKYGSMGIAIPGGKFSLIDVDEKKITEPEITGELVYQGPNVTLGYAEKRDDLLKGDENQGTLITGDMAKQDEDGYYYIVGRKKRFIKIFGNRVNLDETERMLKAAFEDMGCACSGIDDKMSIYITDELHKEAVKKFVSKKTGIHFSAFTVNYIPEIPINEAGKTLYIKLEE